MSKLAIMLTAKQATCLSKNSKMSKLPKKVLHTGGGVGFGGIVGAPATRAAVGDLLSPHWFVPKARRMYPLRCF